MSKRKIKFKKNSDFKFTAKEVEDMLNRKVWNVFKVKDVPKNRRLIGVKWIFAKKKDDRFRPRIVAKGFMEIPGVDYSESFAPVVKDETFRSLVKHSKLLC